MSAPVTRRRALVASAAAALGIGAGVAPALAAPVLSANDARLVELADDLRVVRRDMKTLIKGDRRNCEDIPGYPALEDRRSAGSDALFDVRPDGLVGLVAAADIVQQLADEFGGQEDQAGHAHNLACDVLRIIGGRADA